ncbi:MAG: trypsin-like serine protease, partial [Flavobacteriales bacterium]
MKNVLIASILHFVPLFSICQEIFDKNKYSPMPLPRYSEPVDSAFKQNALIMFDMQNLEFDTIDVNMNNYRTAANVSSSNAIASNEFSQGNVQAYSFSNLQPADQLAGFGSYPVTTIVKLYLTMFNPITNSYSYTACSGAMINPWYIITAGHCVNSSIDPSYAVACTVIPEYNMGSQPFGQTTTVSWYSFPQWTVNGDWNYDMAVMGLASPMGNTTGWLGWGCNNDNSFFTNPSNLFHSFGYPAQDDWGNSVLEGGERMYYMNGYMDFWESTNSMCHYNLGFHGQSGSGLYYKDASNNRYVYGVLSHGNGSTPPYYTCHCRMDCGMFDYFNSIIPSAIGVDESDLSKQILIFPNPTESSFHINFSELVFKKADLEIYNQFGEIIVRTTVDASNPETDIDLTNYTTGVYFIRA